MVTTIKDVAARAEVSVMTVSRVLNGERFVSEPKRERVLSAVAELGFRRNQSARGLPGAKTYVIALLAGMIPNSLSRFIPSYVAGLERGAIRECRRDDYHLAVVMTDPTIDEPVDAVRALISTLRADGLVLLPPFANDAAVLDLLDANGWSYVRVAPDDQFERAPSVRIDEVAAADELTTHLLGLGHRRIGFILGPAAHGGSGRRYQGYARALARQGLAVDESLVRRGDFLFSSGLSEATVLLAQTPPPTAIVAGNDDMAAGVMSAVSRAGLSSPRQIAVVGFDDSESARQTWPMLTTIRQPIAAMGAAAVEMLISHLNRSEDGKPVEARVLDFELIVRGSTVGAD